MRRHFASPDPAVLEPHDHVAWCGDGPGDFDDLALAAFSKAGRRGELLVLVCDEPSVDRLAGLDDLEDLLRTNALQLVSSAERYGTGGDPSSRLCRARQRLDEALALGYSGICAVADVSSRVVGTDEEFEAWLAWEAAVEGLVAEKPFTGVCYFDRQRVPAARLADLATLHPVRSLDFVTPSFQFIREPDVLRVVGELDWSSVARLERVLCAHCPLVEVVVDLSGTDFVDHHALVALEHVARRCGPLRLVGASAVVRRIWALLDLPSPSLELC